MNGSARQLVEYVRASIRSLSLSPEYGTLESVYRELARISGLSKSAWIKMHSGEAINPTAATLDKMVGAVREALRKHAA